MRLPDGKKLSDYEGKTGMTRRVIERGGLFICPGTACRVISARSGLYIVTTPCKCCGNSARVAGIPYNDVVILP